ncbi:MAG: GNAT family N-acetyltransferase [bacterium]
MKIKTKKIKTQGIKISVEIKKKEVARAYLYILSNYPEQKPYGFLAEVSVDENLRGKGVGTKLLNKIIEEAKKNKCYKIVATSRSSRSKVHKFYEYLGFKNVGYEFRIDL